VKHRMCVVALGLGLVLSACSLTPRQTELLEQGFQAPAGVALPVSRTVGPDGVICRYGDGTLKTYGNKATQC
jgi:hypothetical protein